MGRANLFRAQADRRKDVRGGGNRSCTVTFDYGEQGFKTLVSPSFRAACDDAAARWGSDWVAPPCYSTPNTIYNDLAGYTKAQHGQDFGSSDHWRRKVEWFRRSGRSYHDA